MMKVIFFATFFALFSLKICGQVIYSENFGVLNGVQSVQVPLASHTGYQNQNISYTFLNSANSNSSVFISGLMQSVGYNGASAGAHVQIDPPSLIPNTFTTIHFLIEGIDTSEFTDIQLTFGYGIGVYVYNSYNYDIIVEVSEDGVQWQRLNFVRDPVLSPPLGNDWQLAKPSGVIPSVENLRLRFTSASGNGEVLYAFAYTLRIDDIMLVGTKKSASNDLFEAASVKVYPNPVTNGVLNLLMENADEVNVELFDITGKKVLSVKTASKSINVSNLKAGVYILKIKEFDKLSTNKIIIK